MSTVTAPVAQSAATDAALRRYGRFSLFAAVYTYLLVIFGGLVRITESGMGCGDHWPKCNGKWIPDFTLQTLIEYLHRLLGVTIGLVLIGLALYAFSQRRHPRFHGAGSVATPAYLVLGLVVVQGLLGAITVWLELPTLVIVVHFMTALVIMGLLLSGAVRAGVFTSRIAEFSDQVARRHARGATAALGVGFIAIALGALTANTLGAPQACQGFPLCNGQLLPAGVPQVDIQWTHRLLAFALLLHVLMVVLRVHTSTPARKAGVISLFMIVTQLAVAAALILYHLPAQLQVLHLAVGAAVWAALVIWVLLARTAAARPLRD